MQIDPTTHEKPTHTYVYIIIDLFVDTPQGGVKYKNEGWYNIISLYNILIIIDISPYTHNPIPHNLIDIISEDCP